MLTDEQTNRLTSDQSFTLNLSGIRELMTAGRLSLEQALALTLQQGSNLNTAVVRKLMATGQLSLEQALALTNGQCHKLVEVEYGNLNAVVEELTQQPQATSSSYRPSF